MIRGLLTLLVFGLLAYCGTTVPLGAPHKLVDPSWPWATSEARLTFAGHVRAIWHTEQVQDLKNGIEDETGPATQEIKHKVHEVTAP